MRPRVIVKELMVRERSMGLKETTHLLAAHGGPATQELFACLWQNREVLGLRIPGEDDDAD